MVHVRPDAVRAAVIEDGQLVEYKVEREDKIAGNVYLGVVQDIVPGMSSAFVDIGIGRNALLPLGEVTAEPRRKGKRTKRTIQSVLTKGQAIVLQAQKGPIGGKGARVSMRISLPGRHVVLLPAEPGKVGVSKKVADPEERARLKELGRKLCPSEFGLIIRTEAEGLSDEALAEDIRSIVEVWRGIRRHARRKRPAVLWEQPGLVERLIRDILTAELKHLLVDDKPAYESARRVTSQMAGPLARKVKLYTGPGHIFEKYDVEGQVAAALKPRVRLPSGGHINIQETEACTTIDVNTGKFIGDTDLEDTAFRTNCDAVAEICKQLRLRDIGGIIIIDFIDMEKALHRSKLMELLTVTLEKDRSRTRVVHISPLGLVEMTRKRTEKSLLQTLCEKCPTCAGTGMVPSGPV